MRNVITRAVEITKASLRMLEESRGFELVQARQARAALIAGKEPARAAAQAPMN